MFAGSELLDPFDVRRQEKGSLGAARTRHLAQTIVLRSVASEDRLCSVLEGAASAVFILDLDLFFFWP